MIITDKGSRNGVYVNGTRVDHRILDIGDELVLGGGPKTKFGERFRQIDNSWPPPWSWKLRVQNVEYFATKSCLETACAPLNKAPLTRLKPVDVRISKDITTRCEKLSSGDENIVPESPHMVELVLPEDPTFISSQELMQGHVQNITDPDTTAETASKIASPQILRRALVEYAATKEELTTKTISLKSRSITEISDSVFLLVQTTVKSEVSSSEVSSIFGLIHSRDPTVPNSTGKQSELHSSPLDEKISTFVDQFGEPVQNQTMITNDVAFGSEPSTHSQFIQDSYILSDAVKLRGPSAQNSSSNVLCQPVSRTGKTQSAEQDSHARTSTSNINDKLFENQYKADQDVNVVLVNSLLRPQFMDFDCRSPVVRPKLSGSSLDQETGGNFSFAPSPLTDHEPIGRISIETNVIVNDVQHISSPFTHVERASFVAMHDPSYAPRSGKVSEVDVPSLAADALAVLSIGSISVKSVT
jgi:hypothetical protein